MKHFELICEGRVKYDEVFDIYSYEEKRNVTVVGIFGNLKSICTTQDGVINILFTKKHVTTTFSIDIVPFGFYPIFLVELSFFD